MGKRWTKEEEDAILALFKGGKKYPEIAKIQNRKQPGIKARLGIIAVRMLKEGSSEREVLTATGCAVGEDRKSYNQKEQHCKKSIEAKFPGHEFKKVRLDKFVNPFTGRTLELDLYNEELKLAIEYNGRQHYEFCSYFHGEMEEFEKQKVRDAIKEGYCDIFKIELIEIPSLNSFEEIDKFIIQSLHARGIKSDEDKVRALTDDLITYIKNNVGSIADLLEHKFAKKRDFSVELHGIPEEAISKIRDIERAYHSAYAAQNSSPKKTPKKTILFEYFLQGAPFSLAHFKVSRCPLLAK